MAGLKLWFAGADDDVMSISARIGALVGTAALAAASFGVVGTAQAVDSAGSTSSQQVAVQKFDNDKKADKASKVDKEALREARDAFKAAKKEARQAYKAAKKEATTSPSRPAGR